MTKIFIGTPAFDGKVNVQYAIALSETISFLTSQNIQCLIGINTSGSLLVAERNRILKQFLKTDCTHLLCVDSDLGWPAQAVFGMIKYDKDFIAGLYPARSEVNTFLFRAILDENNAMKSNDQGLFPMAYIPAGFMLIKRHVIERMNVHFSHLYYEPKSAELKHENGYCLFDTEVWEGEFWGEDYVFCRRVREAGFDIWVDPMIEFDHAGKRGALCHMLKQQEKKEEVLD